jgi:predicted MPP superfamily phosphohydrolase
MLEYCLILVLWLSADLFWWRSADRRLRRTSHATLWRMALGCFMAAQVLYMGWMVLCQTGLRIPELWPHPWSIAAYLWHVLFLPLGILLVFGGWLMNRRARARVVATSPPTDEVGAPRFTRRQILGASVAAAPPLLTLAATGRAASQMGEFRLRQTDLHVPGLPADLDGLRIAHVTDIHIGRFMPVEATGPIIDAINNVPCDLVMFTGDLLDASCTSVQPGIDFIRRLNPRQGLVMIEGNHDVMMGADRFEQTIKDAGLPLLLDESKTIRVAGRATPVQILGVTWGETVLGREVHRHGKDANLRFRKSSAQALVNSVQRVAALREPDAFPILLSHHPHGFDPAAALGIPLVLSGHTHGGQLMLTRHIGVGPLRFRYWSGAYRKQNSRLFISNGLGSWFPLRVNAPAEIVNITLRRAGV